MSPTSYQTAPSRADKYTQILQAVKTYFEIKHLAAREVVFSRFIKVTQAHIQGLYDLFALKNNINA